MGKLLPAALIAGLAAGSWFACGQLKSSKRSEGSPSSATKTDSATDTDTDVATDATDAGTDSATDTSTAEASGIACTEDHECSLQYVDCAGKTLEEKNACQIEAASSACCEACDCQINKTLNNAAAVCVNGQCAALYYPLANDEAKCMDPKPTDKGEVFCMNQQCNNSGDLFKWQTPAEAAKEKALCVPCPEC